ncbi:formimidoylglutamate deiminase [Sulfitobacter aestuariivivens]|uniref:Formimidoylglutamate deiminase n=1 Tax=Sulfitobacter aestuariivivens TaxID=2766981 RepID=A0A927HFQ2_9RHOB|nr:formimidoylglutamate deiminase [Sulfitobacter aestuariivivens]MBD3666082.1 formimidoylglutamate deiminase [Sulfitobacter aestuariivivens]
MIFAKRALVSDGWVLGARLTLQDGKIAQIDIGQDAQAGDVRVDTLLPALGNLHSHSFQRAMAGMTEHRVTGRDNFWTWRDLMYRFTAALTPEQTEAIAAQVFLEMQEAGFASVGEFHYMHHQPGGMPYADLATLSGRIIAAAKTSGIGLTHLPVLYSYGGAGQVALEHGQARFGNDVDTFLRLVDGAKTAMRDLPDDSILGVAPHSLRATSPDELRALIAARPEGPIHMHIAEQPKEVADIEAWLGARPVDWALAELPLDARWCLIHATHMTDAETSGLALSGAVAGLCPVTEANLGDGAFNGPLYLNEAGVFGVGSDSNVSISLTEELRMLEYSQRLRDLSRNVMVAGAGSVGETLYCGAATGSAQALGRDAGVIAEGRLADLVAIDSSDPTLCALGTDALLDGLVFAAKDRVVRDVWSAGRHCVRDGRHVAHEEITAGYRKAIRELTAAL